MSNKRISVFVLVIILLIIAVFIVDYILKRPGRSEGNPYEYNVEAYRKVPEELIAYKETKNFQVQSLKLTGIDVYDGKIWLTGDRIFQVITPDGMAVSKQEIHEGSRCIKACDESVYIGFEDHIEKYSHEGEYLEKWDIPGRNCVFTSVDADKEYVYVADAGNRRVLVYTFTGDLKGEFSGQSEGAAGHGFIVPSAHFDLVVNKMGELWVVNPGKHALEQYSSEGKLMDSWRNSSMEIEGFTGCCNPAEITVLQDGSFVTSEKGLVRIKVYNRKGELQSVVAGPDKFGDEGNAPEVAADENGVIYALDFDRGLIRVFETIK